jgi:hypothetical protein
MARLKWLAARFAGFRQPQWKLFPFPDTSVQETKILLASASRLCWRRFCSDKIDLNSSFSFMCTR